MSIHGRISLKGRRQVLAAVSAAAVLVSPCAPALAGDAAPAAADASGPQIEQWSLEQLLNIQITTVSKSSEKEFEAPGVISVLTQDEIRRFGGTTLSDLLTRIPGLVGSSVYMTDRSVISPRGDQLKPSSSNVLFLINGRPVREVLEGGIKSEMLESFPVDVIERIEVVKGPGSVLYGTQAVSAVINVITKTPERTGLSVSALGTNGGFDSSATATLKAGDLQVIAGGQYHQKPEWQMDYNMRSTPLSPTLTQQITVPNKGPGAYFGANYKGFRLSGAYAGWDNSFFVPDVLAIGGASWNKRFADAGWGQQLTKTWRTDVDVQFARSKFAVDANPFITRDSHEVVGEWTNFIDLPHRSQFVFGGLYDKIKGNEVYHGLGFPLTISDASPWSAAGYAQLDFHVVDSFKLIGGVQVNKIQGRDADWVPRFGAILMLPGGLHAKALYGEAFRAPGINELSLQHPGLHGDPNLNPERTANFDLSVGYGSHHGQVTASYFRNKQTDMIVQDRRQVPALYVNAGEARIEGFEVEGKYYVSKQLYLMASVLYHHDTAPAPRGDQGLSPIAPFSTKTGLSYQWDAGHTLSLFNAYQGDLDEALTTGTANPAPGAYNLLYLHGRFDLGHALKMTGKREFGLLLQIDNLLDKTVWVPAWGTNDQESMPYNKGRIIYVGASATF
jgi:outer membrane receptor protein involved in Fe transport